MKLKELLEKQEENKKILIVSDLSRAQSLFRQYEAQTGMLIKNITCKTISQLAMDVYHYWQAESSFQKLHRVLEPDEAMMLFRNIIFENKESLCFFIDENMLDITTSKNIFRSINIIRSNGWSGEECKDNGNEDQSRRIQDLKFLIERYEDYLNTNQLLDQEALLSSVIGFLQNNNLSKNKEENQKLFGGEVYALSEDMEYLTGLQSKFVSLLLTDEESKVNIYDNIPNYDMLSDVLKNKSVRFFKGYGSYNEAAYIANDILANQIPFGLVTVVYTSSSQLPALDAAFKGNGLRARHLSKRPLSDDAFIALTRRILAWARDNFSEKALDTVLASPAIRVKAKNKDGEEKNVIGGQAYYNLVLNARNRMQDSFALGWGYERNVQFIQKEKALLEADKKEELPSDAEIKIEQKKAVLEMYEKLIAVFGEDGKAYDEILPQTIYCKLVEFIDKYHNSALFINNENAANGLAGIKNLSGVVSMENRKISLQKAIDYIDELLASADGSEKCEESAVSIQKLNQWLVLERPYIYIIGLSLKDFQGQTIESPVLTDNEMEVFLKEGYRPTIKNEAERKERDIRRTLAAFDGTMLTMGYSDYDTVDFCENNPSGVYRALLHQLTGKNIQELPEFVYGNPDSVIKISNPHSAALHAQLSYGINLKTSNSSLEIFLDCPKQYAYEKRFFIPKKEYAECDYGRWLDALHYGSFFHLVAQKYITKNLIKPRTQSYEEKVQAADVKQMVLDVKKDMLLEYPAPFLEKAEAETVEIENCCLRFFNALHKQLTSPDGDLGWRVLVAEKEFSGLIYRVTDLKGVPYDFELNGYVDRIDYRFDREQEKIYLRVIDYKTGKKKNKESNNDVGKVIQHAIYKKAVMEPHVLLDNLLGEIDRLEEDNKASALYQKNPGSVMFDSFQYTFPQEQEEQSVLRIEGAEVEGNNVTRLQVELTAMSELNNYPDHMDLVRKLNEYKDDSGYEQFKSKLDELYDCIVENGKPNSVEMNYCKYCNYGNICPKRKAGEI